MVFTLLTANFLAEAIHTEVQRPREEKRQEVSPGKLPSS